MATSSQLKVYRLLHRVSTSGCSVGKNRHLHPLVDVEVSDESGIVLLDDNSGSPLDGLGAHSTLRTTSDQVKVVSC